MSVFNIISDWDVSGEEGNLVFKDKLTGETVLNLKDTLSIAADAPDIWVKKSGNDTLGQGTFLSPYLTITKAFAMVTATRKNIYVMDGDYSEAAALTWPLISGVRIKAFDSQWGVVISAPGTTQVLEIAPGVQSSTFEAAIENIQIDHDRTGQDGIKVTHTSVGKKLLLYLHNVSMEADSDSDKSITVTHGGSGNAVRIYAKGDNGDIGGAIYFETKDGGDKLYLNGVNALGGIESSADAVALIIRMINGLVKHEGVTGGNAAQAAIFLGCYSKTSDTYAAVDTNDLAGSHTETIA